MLSSLIGGLIGGALGGAIWGSVWIYSEKDVIWLVLLVGLFSGIGARMFTPANRRGVISGTIAAAITLIAAVGTPLVVAKMLINEEQQQQRVPIELAVVEAEGLDEETEGDEDMSAQEVDVVIEGDAMPAGDVSVLNTRVTDANSTMDLILYAISGVLAYVVAGSGAAKKPASSALGSSDLTPPTEAPNAAADAAAPPEPPAEPEQSS